MAIALRANQNNNEVSALVAPPPTRVLHNPSRFDSLFPKGDPCTNLEAGILLEVMLLFGLRHFIEVYARPYQL